MAEHETLLPLEEALYLKLLTTKWLLKQLKRTCISSKMNLNVGGSSDHKLCDSCDIWHLVDALGHLFGSALTITKCRLTCQCLDIGKCRQRRELKHLSTCRKRNSIDVVSNSERKRTRQMHCQMPKMVAWNGEL